MTFISFNGHWLGGKLLEGNTIITWLSKIAGMIKNTAAQLARRTWMIVISNYYGSAI